jgi:hypothetical protein
MEATMPKVRRVLCEYHFSPGDPPAYDFYTRTPNNVDDHILSICSTKEGGFRVFRTSYVKMEIGRGPRSSRRQSTEELEINLFLGSFENALKFVTEMISQYWPQLNTEYVPCKHTGDLLFMMDCEAPSAFLRRKYLRSVSDAMAESSHSL